MIRIKYKTGGFPQYGSLFIQIDNEQPELTGSIQKKPIASTQEPVIKSIRKAVSQVIKEHIYG